MSDLQARLKLLREAMRRRGFEESRPLPQPQRARPAETGLEGWERIGELTYARTLRFPSPLAEGELSPLLIPSGLSPGDLVFLDTETRAFPAGQAPWSS